MHGINPIDRGRDHDWGKTSGDYAKWRPTYPDGLFDRLQALGVGVPGQRILDLGTGVGFLARRFARQGCEVVGIDHSEGQIEEAKQQAKSEGLDIDFFTSTAEESGLPDASFDLLTAGQSWLYFDRERMVPEVRRLLKPGGLLVTCHFSWLPRLDPIARASEELVLKHNPDWSASDWAGVIPPIPRWAHENDFEVRGMFFFDQPIPFTRDSWRGRIRACRGIGASLEVEDVETFDREHDELLRSIAGNEFTILHRVDAHIFRPG